VLQKYRDTSMQVGGQSWGILTCIQKVRQKKRELRRVAPAVYYVLA
jgi:hypothetical protein